MDGVDLWYVRTSEVGDARALVWSLLTAEERKKHDAFRFDENKHEYLVTRAVERAVLADRLGRAPKELVFERTHYGRPLLVGASSLCFNLTNTVHLIACAVTSGRELGVDAEPLSRGDDVLDVAGTVFTAYERAMLDSMVLEARRRRAVELWTLKEAYMKARGLGMSLPPNDFELTFEVPDSPALRCAPSVDADPSRWTFAMREIGDHLVSVCVERRAVASGAGVDIAIERADLAAMLSRHGL